MKLSKKALREILEETGVKAKIIEGFRRQVEYIMPNGIKKQVVFFVAEYANQDLQSNLFEISNVMIGTIDEALNTLSHDYIKRILLDADAWLTSRIE